MAERNHDHNGVAPGIYDDIVLDLEPKSVRVTLAGEPYLLREASEDAACRFHNAAMRAAKMSDGKVTGVDGVADSEPILVAGCLFKLVKVKGRDVEQPVSLQFVRDLPARVVKPLFERAKRISGLDEEPESVLRKRIAEDTKKLDELIRSKGESVPKGPPALTPASSDSPPDSGGPSESSSDGPEG